eukprot:5570270-Karenia_brevis.AAC.1
MSSTPNNCLFLRTAWVSTPRKKAMQVSDVHMWDSPPVVETSMGKGYWLACSFKRVKSSWER